MIFLSHTKNDKPIVEPIAIRLAQVFGQDNVFYDSWSIQPGDGIIDRMNDGLSKCKYFFFFVTRESLQSKMVTLEWQNALMKKLGGDTKFIPVKLGDCAMPVLLMQSLYIDVFNVGLEMGIRQMIDVINGDNTFRPQFAMFHNIKAFVNRVEVSSAEIEIKAMVYSEPISKFCILVNNSLNNVSIECKSDSVRITGQQENLALSNGETYNAFLESVSRATTPGFPYRLSLKTKDGSPLDLVMIMHAKTEKSFEAIPMEIIYKTLNSPS